MNLNTKLFVDCTQILKLNAALICTSQETLVVSSLNIASWEKNVTKELIFNLLLQEKRILKTTTSTV